MNGKSLYVEDSSLRVQVFFSHDLQSLFGTVDDVVLQTARQRGKEGAVSRDTHDEVLVFFGILLRVQQSFARNDVELHMAAFLIEIGANERHEIFQTRASAQSGRMELLVEQRAVGRDIMVEPGNGIRRRGRTVDIPARRR